MKIGNEDVKLYLGGSEISKIMLGTSQVYSGGSEPTPVPYSGQYLTIESLQDNNTISFTMGTGMTTAITTAVTSVSVSTDNGSTWTQMQNIGANASLSVTLDAGEKAIWKGEANGYSMTTATTKSTLFSSTGNYKVYGNITSLLYDDDFLNQDNPTLPDFNCFTNLFYNSTGLTDASNLIMHFTCYPSTSRRPLGFLFYGCTSLTIAPELNNISFVGNTYTFRDMFNGCTSLTTAPELTATTLTEGCYQNMFRNCTSLTTAPSILPATTLVDKCYYSMFQGCTNLRTAPELPATTLASSCYYHMFDDCTSLTAAPELSATTLASSCYSQMFAGCTNLTTAPSILPATTLAQSCYSNMFSGCTSLTIAPELPATTLASSCYNSMFIGCTSLTTAPELPATTLVQSCYSYMFRGCTSLNYIKCLATDISATNCTSYWVDVVAATGTFVKAASMSSWTNGAGGIPYGWTVENYGDTPTPKWVATYDGGRTASAECDNSSAITQNEIDLTNLTDVVIGDCVTSIGDESFRDCSSLTSVTIPDSVTSIGESAFESCMTLTYVTIGSGVTDIGNTAFMSCNSIVSVTIYATIPPTLGAYPFEETYCTIYVPSSSVNTYQTEIGWSDYASRIQAIP